MKIKLNPKHGDCWNIFAHVLFKKGDYEGARNAVTMALETVHPVAHRWAKTRSV
jgi:hypothetical protein